MKASSKEKTYLYTTLHLPLQVTILAKAIKELLTTFTLLTCLCTDSIINSMATSESVSTLSSEKERFRQHVSFGQILSVLHYYGVTAF